MAQNAPAANEEPFDASMGGPIATLPDDEIPGIVRVECPLTATVGTAFKHRSGHLLTADTSVNFCEDVVLSLPSGRRVGARVVARDRAADLAMLFPKEPVPGRALEFAKSPALPVGTSTAAVGYPSGYIGQTALLSFGYIAGLYRHKIDKDRYVTKLIIGGNYNAGLAGSPLLDKGGAVLGILSGMPSPLSEAGMSALKALKEERGSDFTFDRPGGEKLPLSRGQVVAMVLEELVMQSHFIVGLAAPLPGVSIFLTNNGVDP